MKSNARLRFSRTAIATTLTLLLCACSDSDSDKDSTDNGDNSLAAKQDVSVQFAAKFGDADLRCGETVAVNGTDYRVDDFRFFISDLKLLSDNGTEAAVELDQDGQWQYENVALVDLENATADACSGTDETNNVVSGSYTAPTAGNVSGMCFTLGVPYALNHEFTSRNDDAPAPLNATGMSWSWMLGHKFMRIDGVGSPGDINQSYHIHLGSTGCSNAAEGGENDSSAVPTAECVYPNTVEICLDSFNADTQQVAVDLQALLGDSDVSYNTEGTAAGCMSFNNDPECAEIMPNIGLSFSYEDGANEPLVYPAETQTVFRAESL
ncbi:metallo-mystery pair system four-Cys motif protein [Granulosicoccaceae sp. 1_MG-2023]|nr:metallo-mystery pair system four-Cys motif protein [Granulosicoccaceae sp. 1_MG-2023]